MSRPREANRAEAIVKGIGGIVMLLLLWCRVKGWLGSPGTRNPGDAIAWLLGMLKLFVVLVGAITVIGLIVWLIVLKGPRNLASSATTTPNHTQPSARSSALSCADCGSAITPGIARYCRKNSKIFEGRSLCMSCQAHYRA